MNLVALFGLIIAGLAPVGLGVMVIRQMHKNSVRDK